VKGSSRGNARPEFEYEIPLEDALQMLQLFCSSVIEKTRHYVNVTNNIWEVDVFEGANTGLIVTEIELQSDDETYTVPPWAGLNVSSDHRYANVQLAATPYSSWPVSERTTL
jgi:CYTH domain-containing protein